MDISKRVYVGPVGFDPLSWQESLTEFEKLLDAPGQHQIATANAEFVVAASGSLEIAKILNQSSMVLPDGAGIIWASGALIRKGFTARFLYGLRSFFRALLFRPQIGDGEIKERIAGADFIIEALRLCAKRGKRVFLLGALSDESRKQAAERIRGLVPGITIAGEAGGSDPFGEGDDLARRVNDSGAEFIVVCFGHPKQERWIKQFLPKMPAVKAAIGGGGTFDFLSGYQKRTPESFRRVGLEGLARVASHPIKRLRKFWISYPVFIWIILKQR